MYQNQTGLAPIIIILIVVAVLGGGYLAWQYFGQPAEEELVIKSSVEVKPVEVKTATFDVFIKNEKSGEETFLMQLDKVYERHYHFAEYHNGNLYIIREFGYDPQTMKYSEDYIRELWKYDKEEEGEKLFSAKGIDFRVDPKEKFIAIESENILRIIDLNTDEVKVTAPVGTLIHPDLSGEFAIGLRDWPEDGRSFWGYLAFTAYPQQFFRIDTTNWRIIKYNVSSLHLNTRESTLNPNLGKIVYSDAPMVFDVESKEEFERSQRSVTLYLYDLDSGEEEIIDTSKAEWFKPKWVDNTTIEYTKGGERVIKKIR